MFTSPCEHTGVFSSVHPCDLQEFTPCVLLHDEAAGPMRKGRAYSGYHNGCGQHRTPARDYVTGPVYIQLSVCWFSFSDFFPTL